MNLRSVVMLAPALCLSVPALGAPPQSGTSLPANAGKAEKKPMYVVIPPPHYAPSYYTPSYYAPPRGWGYGTNYSLTPVLGPNGPYYVGTGTYGRMGR